MKKLLISIAILSLTWALVAALPNVINVGVNPNDKSGDTIRLAFQKINTNFTWLSTNGIVAGGTNVLKGNGGSLTNIAATNIVGGMTTNLQFTFMGERTNTLYFINGVLMNVTQP